MVDSVGGGYACVAGAKEDGMGGGHVRDEVAYVDGPPPDPSYYTRCMFDAMPCCVLEDRLLIILEPIPC